MASDQQKEASERITLGRFREITKGFPDSSQIVVADIGNSYYRASRIDCVEHQDGTKILVIAARKFRIE